MRYVRAKPRKNKKQFFVSHFVHRIVLSEDEIDRFFTPRIDKELFNWCVENFGQAFREWAYSTRHYVRSKKKNITFYFLTKEDALAFKLRWE